jgi:glutamate racemase
LMIHQKDGDVVFVETVVFECTHYDYVRFSFCLLRSIGNDTTLPDRLHTRKYFVAWLTLP